MISFVRRKNKYMYQLLENLRVSNRGPERVAPIAPNGEVSKMDSTATVSICKALSTSSGEGERLCALTISNGKGARAACKQK